MLAFSLENLLLPVFPLPPLLFLHHATSLLHLAQVTQSREGPLPTLGVSGGRGKSEGSVSGGRGKSEGSVSGGRGKSEGSVSGGEGEE